MPLILIDAITLQNWHYGNANVELRIDVSQAFTASDGSPIQPGDYVAVPCTPNTGANTLAIAAFNLYSTTDGQDIQSATYRARFYDSNSGARICDYKNYGDFAVPYAPTERTWANLANKPPVSDRPDFTQWIRGTMDMVLARQTFVDGDSTPSIASFYSFRTNNSSTVNITTFKNPYDGKVIDVLIDDSHTSVFGVHYAQGTFLLLTYDGTQWHLLNPIGGGSSSDELAISLVNDTVTGTVANRMAKLSGGNAIEATTSDTVGLVGVVVAGAGTSGSCSVAVGGLVAVDADAAVTAGNYAIASTTAAGKVHDGGSSRPTTAQTVGRFVQTTSGAQSVSMIVFPPETVYGSGGGGGGTDWGYFDPRTYGAIGDGATNDTTAFISMIAAIGSMIDTVKIPRTSGSFVVGNLTFPINVTLDFTSGGSLQVVTGRTVLILGKVLAQSNQIFFNVGTIAAGLGVVSFGNASAINSTDGFNPQQKDYWAEWWGAVGNNTVHSADFLDAAFEALPNGGRMRLAGKFYYLEHGVTFGYKLQCTLIGDDTEVGLGGHLVKPIFVYQGSAGGTVFTAKNVYSCTFKGFGLYGSNGSSPTNKAATGFLLTYDNPPPTGVSPNITSHCYLDALQIWALSTRTDWRGIYVTNTGGNNEHHTIRECELVGSDPLGTDQIGIDLAQSQVQRVVIERNNFSSLGVAVSIQGNVLAYNNIYGSVGTVWRSQSANDNCVIIGDDAEQLVRAVDIVAINGALTIAFIACKYNGFLGGGETALVAADAPIHFLQPANLTFNNCNFANSFVTGQDFGPFFVGNEGGSFPTVEFNNCIVGTASDISIYGQGFSTCRTVFRAGEIDLRWGGASGESIQLLKVAAPGAGAPRVLMEMAGTTNAKQPDPLIFGGVYGVGGLFPVIPLLLTVVGAAGSTTYRLSIIAVDSKGRRSAVFTLPNTNHFLQAVGNATLSVSNYLHLTWLAQFPAPDHFEVYDVNPSNSDQWRFVANVTPSGTENEHYDIVANPSGSYTATMPLFNEAGIVNLRNLVLFPNDFQFTDGDTTPSIALGNDFFTANSAPTTITNFDNGTNGQIIRVRIDDANTTIATNSNIITGYSGNIAGVQGVVYTFKYVSGVWHGIFPQVPCELLLASISAVDMNTATPTALFTVPSGKTCVVTKVNVRNASANLTTASDSFGWNSASFNDWQTGIVFTALTTSANFRTVFALNGAKIGTAGQIFKVLNNILQGAPATTTMDIFGYLF